MVNINELKKFTQDKYARNLVLKTDNVEIIVVCWMPGQASPVHHHGQSDGIILVVEGEMAFTNYFPDGRAVSGILRDGDVCHTPVGVKHRIANNSNRELVSFHIYAKPLNPELYAFDLGYDNDVQIEEVALPQETIRFLMAMKPVVEQIDTYMI